MPRSALLTRRGARVTPAWSPANLPGVAAWWHADDLAGADGSAVSSWSDRINGLALTQATAGQQPTLHTSALNGKKGVTFTGANSTWLGASSTGTLPTQGPFTVFYIQNPTVTSANTHSTTFEVSSSTSNGWSAGRAGGSGTAAKVTTPGKQDYINTVHGQGNNDPAWLSATMLSNQHIQFHRNNLQPANTDVSGTVNAGAGANRITMGYSRTFSGLALTGDIFDVVVCTGALSAADHYLFAKWVYATYGLICGTPYNDTSGYVATPSGDASGTCVEHSIVDFGAGNTFNGHRYWNGFVPLGSGSQANENPSINFSDDGNTWSQSGITNPVVAYPGGGAAGNNADPCLFNNVARDSKLYLYYVRENATPLSTSGVYVKSSTDGVTWSSATQVISDTAGGTAADQHLEWKVAWDGSQYVAWYVDFSGGAGSAVLRRMTSSSPTSGWTNDTLCTLPIPGSRRPWHFGTPLLIGGKWVAAFSDYDSIRNIWIASSSDGVTWTVGAQPILIHSTGGFFWDSSSLYRLQFIDAGDGTNLHAWYTAEASLGDTTFHLSKRVTIPRTEIP